ncbi:MAG: type II toxin-antitoxin system VapC family toxin [Syntrophobacteraceae bacterium]|nr:type II toxin-antitoxin system VapC family toxin [Syntrophobacteraceae bacterium]
MILVDTSVWVSHLRRGENGLTVLLNEGRVVCHSFILGELACGNLKNRSGILSLLEALPMADQAGHEEAMEFIESHRLMGKGLGYIDVHLLASAVLSDARLWTFDGRLIEAASKLNKQYLPSHA